MEGLTVFLAFFLFFFFKQKTAYEITSTTTTATTTTTTITTVTTVDTVGSCSTATILRGRWWKERERGTCILLDSSQIIFSSGPK